MLDKIVVNKWKFPEFMVYCKKDDPFLLISISVESLKASVGVYKKLYVEVECSYPLQASHLERF